jgi:hypothetical protein
MNHSHYLSLCHVCDTYAKRTFNTTRKALSPDERSPFEALARADKDRYTEEMKSYSKPDQERGSDNSDSDNDNDNEQGPKKKKRARKDKEAPKGKY